MSEIAFLVVLFIITVVMAIGGSLIKSDNGNAVLFGLIVGFVLLSCIVVECYYFGIVVGL